MAGWYGFMVFMNVGKLSMIPELFKVTMGSTSVKLLVINGDYIGTELNDKVTVSTLCCNWVTICGIPHIFQVLHVDQGFNTYPCCVYNSSQFPIRVTFTNACVKFSSPGFGTKLDILTRNNITED